MSNWLITTESSHIKQAFEAEYPKLLRLSSDLWCKLQQFHLEIMSASNTNSLTAENAFIEDQESISDPN